MNDLETRLRDELHREPAWRSADEMIGTVRRASRRRQARYRAGVGAAAALALAAVGASIWQVGSDQHVAGAPVNQWRGPDGVSVTNDGVFGLTQNVGCAACDTVWSRAADGSWTRLHDFLPDTAPSDPLGEGPVNAVRMAPDGQNGWAWGAHFWATHDGGRTWRDDNPAAGGPTGLAGARSVLVGTDVAWTTAWDHGRPSLWRSDVGSDSWAQVSLPEHYAAIQHQDPRHLDLLLNAVLPDDRAVITVGARGETATLISSPSGWTETTLTSTPVPSTLFDGALPVRRVSLSGLAGTTYSDFTWTGGRGSHYGLGALGVSATADGSSVSVPRWLFLHDGHAAVLDASGVHEARLPVGGDDVQELSAQGEHVWLVTEGRVLWASHDGGLTWSVQDGPAD